MATRTVVAPDPELALDHLVEAQAALGHDNCGPDNFDDDHRLGFLFGAEQNWNGPVDRRWAAAKALIAHDTHPCGAIMHESLGLLVTITDRLEEALLDGSGPRDDVAEVRSEARELRDAYERLGEIVRAVVAVPLLSEGR
jgi:hypothetical protein